MRTSVLILSTAAVTLAATSLLTPPSERIALPVQGAAPPAIVADPAVVIEAYEEWRADFVAGPHVVEIPLTRTASHIDRRQGLRGTFTIDLDDSLAVVRVEQSHDAFDAWLVANVDGPRKSFMPEPGDECRHLGSMCVVGDHAELEVDLSGPEWGDIALDTIAVTRAGVRPDVESLLIGQSNVFERLYGRELAAQRQEEGRRVGTGMPLALIMMQGIPIGAFHPGTQLQALVDQGEKLFFVATFSGNGRTCGSCHPAENNFTLDKAFIAQMAAANPLDPLFIAEFDPNFDPSLQGGKLFEQPLLMHSFALILENLDGFQNLPQEFTMRAVSHTFAQDMQRLKPISGVSPPKERLGWGGDGAPGAGRLRDFATGAVTQHFTKSFGRVAGVDFVLPTSTELDAFEAFQLALGRQAEFDLSTFLLDDVNADIGRQNFQGFCGFCHDNAGANSFFTTKNGVVVPADPNFQVKGNGNFDTGVERFLTNNPDGTGLPRPIDGGFGTQPQGMAPPGGPPIPNFDGSFGDQSFNTPSVVEFADTVPGFHNHITASTPLDPDPVMAAVAFYNTPEFGGSSSGQFFFGGPMGMSTATIKQISFFLRAINAVQNDRNARRFLKRASGLASINFILFEPVIMRGVQLADAEVLDAIDQCATVGIFPDPIPNLQAASTLIAVVQDTGQPTAVRIAAIGQAFNRLLAAEADLVQ